MCDGAGYAEHTFEVMDLFDWTALGDSLFANGIFAREDAQSTCWLIADSIISKCEVSSKKRLAPRSKLQVDSTFVLNSLDCRKAVTFICMEATRARYSPFEPSLITSVDDHLCFLNIDKYSFMNRFDTPVNNYYTNYNPYIAAIGDNGYVFVIEDNLNFAQVVQVQRMSVGSYAYDGSLYVPHKLSCAGMVANQALS